MSIQSDWVGGGVNLAPKPFKDVRNTRESVAEEKARLCLELGSLLKRPPARVVNGSVQAVREWQAARAAATKVAGSSRSSHQGGRQLAQQRPGDADGDWQHAEVRMRIEALRIDSANLTMEEMERYSFILGDNTMRDTLLRAQDECDEESETYRRVRELEGELEESEDQLAQSQDERDHLQDGLEAFAKFLRSGKALTPAQMLAAADVLDAYLKSPEFRGAADTMDDALSELGA